MICIAMSQRPRDQLIASPVTRPGVGEVVVIQCTTHDVCMPDATRLPAVEPCVAICEVVNTPSGVHHVLRILAA